MASDLNPNLQTQRYIDAKGAAERLATPFFALSERQINGFDVLDIKCDCRETVAR